MSSPPLTAAEAWSWVEHMLRVESDVAAYEWPRKPDSYDRSVELDEQSRAAGDRARSLDASDDLYVRALGKWDAPVKPAAHHGRPMRRDERRLVYQLRGCDDAHAGICAKCFGWIELRDQESGASEACSCPECPLCAKKHAGGGR